MFSPFSEGPILRSPEDVLGWLKKSHPMLVNDCWEMFLCLFLGDRMSADRLVGSFISSNWKREHLRVPVAELAEWIDTLSGGAGLSKMVLVHNHPDNWLEPSGPDIETTERIALIAALYEIQLTYHMIVTTGWRYRVFAPDPSKVRLRDVHRTDVAD